MNPAIPAIYVERTTSTAVMANLLVQAPGVGEQFWRMCFYARGVVIASDPPQRVIAATIDFGGSANPFINALPECVTFDLDADPVMLGLTEAFEIEAERGQCESQVVINRLVEVITLIMLRRTIGRDARRVCDQMETGAWAAMARKRRIRQIGGATCRLWKCCCIFTRVHQAIRVCAGVGGCGFDLAVQ